MFLSVITSDQNLIHSVQKRLVGWELWLLTLKPNSLW